ncbi:MAG: sigma-70 family RNA polymerase sigma factor [Clostridia bacterium]|nr:sigma-70 family RNA polymerase sigma factor [Clostridia bacterium]
MDDQQIIALYFDRDERALIETDRKYNHYCYKIAYNILSSREDSEESVNDTFADAWENIPPSRPSVLSAFLGKITRRIAIDRWRYRTAEKRGGGEVTLVLEELGDCIAAPDSTESVAEANRLKETINRFLLSLPQHEQKVFLCRYWYMDSVASISRHFGYSESKVKSMLYRTREKLRHVLEKEDFS